MKPVFGIRFARILFVLSILSSANASFPLITEVMSNPLGAWNAIPGDDSNEFIEIYNAGTDSVDLAGWIIYDGDGDDVLTSAADGMAILPSDSDGIYTSTILAPGCFALILDPEYTDAANDQPYDWPSNTLILTISTTTDLGGSRLSDDDPVYLITPSADTVDFYPASVTPIEGKSIERVGWDEESGWAISIASAGCTAGLRNSVWPYPHDLCLDSLAVAENPVETPPANVTAFIRNSGETVFSDGIVYLFDGIEEAQLLDSASIPTLAPGEVVEVSLSTALSDGYYSLFARLGEDDFSGNNSAEIAVLFGPSGWPIRITEIMFMPLTGMSEWFELYNASDEAQELSGWRFGDAVSTHDLPDFVLEPNGFAVLCADSTAFSDSLCEGALLLEPGSWSALNNDGDAVRLIDSDGLLRQRIDFDADAFGDCMTNGISAEVTESGGLACCPEGSTPGCENAVWHLPTGGNSVRAEPNPFDPSDGPTTIRVCLPGTGLEVAIYDRSGRRRRTLCRPDEPLGYEISWDGKDDFGRLLPAGIFIIFASDLDGNSAKAAVAIKGRRR